MVVHTQESGVVRQQPSNELHIDGIKTAKLPHATAPETVDGAPDILDILRGGRAEETEEPASFQKTDATTIKKLGFRKWFHIPESLMTSQPAKSEPEAETKAEPKPKAESKVLAKAEPKLKTEPKFLAMAEPKLKTESKVRAKAEPKPNTELKVLAKAEPKPNTELKVPAKAEPKLKTEPKVLADARIIEPSLLETSLLEPMRSVAASVKDKWSQFLTRKDSPPAVPAPHATASVANVPGLKPINASPRIDLSSATGQLTKVAYSSPAVALSSNPVRNGDSDVIVESEMAPTETVASAQEPSEDETATRAAAVTAPEAAPTTSEEDKKFDFGEEPPVRSERRLISQSEKRMAQTTPDVKLLPPHEELTRAVVPRTESEYRLKVGDVLTVNDRSFTELGSQPSSDNMPILPDGTAYIYPVGVVQAAGMTLRELNDLVDREARKFIKHPAITISISSIQQVGVYVRGEVAQPGYYLPDATGGTLASGKGTAGGSSTSGMTVTRALQLAGGLTTDADFNQVVVFDFAGKPVASVDLWRVIVNGDTKQDIILQSGDSVLVPRGIPRPEALESLGLLAADKLRVQIWGAVKSPGLYELKAKDSIISALSVAGGPTQAAGNKVTLARQNANGTITRKIFKLSDAIGDPTSPGRFNVREGDLVLIGESVSKKVANKVGVAVLTFVGAAGLIVLSKAIPQAQSRTQTNNTSASTNNANTSIISFP